MVIDGDALAGSGTRHRRKIGVRLVLPMEAVDRVRGRIAQRGRVKRHLPAVVTDGCALAGDGHATAVRVPPLSIVTGAG